MMRVHFLALGKTGWGEVTLALRVAQDLVGRGHRCTFTLPKPLMTHVGRCGFDVVEDPGERGSRFLQALDEQSAGSDVRVLVDLHLTGSALFSRGVHPEQLLAKGTVVGLDTWHFKELGPRIDQGRGMRVVVESIWRDLPHRIVPVPFVRPTVPLACNLLPRGRIPTAACVRDRRSSLVDEGSLVLVCTSWWQHHLGQTQALGVAELLGLYLSRQSNINVLHVGPVDLPWSGVLGDRYRRVDPLPLEQFEETAAAADLVVSLNASATTNTTAMHVGTPVLTLWNRWTAVGPELRFRLGYEPSPELEAWVREFHPVPRFALWPMDWTSVMETLLDRNPYAEVLHLVDLLDERRFHEVCKTLLSPNGREEAGAVRARFLEAITLLPQPSELVERFVE